MLCCFRSGDDTLRLKFAVGNGNEKTVGGCGRSAVIEQFLPFTACPVLFHKLQGPSGMIPFGGELGLARIILSHSVELLRQ
jgi:hypothetical protein